MTWLPRHTSMGELSIHEVFVYFDGPRVFSARSETDQLYVAGWAEEEATFDLWLYMPVSKARLRMIRSGHWTLRESFEKPEGPILSVALNHNADIADAVEMLEAADLREEWLPAPDYRIQLPTPTLAPAISPEELSQKAKQEGRTRLRIEISSQDRFRSEAPTRRVAALLSATQNVLDNFGLVELDANPAQDGRFARQVIDRMETDLLELAAASFVIEIGAVDGEDLLGDSPIGRVSDRLVGLLSTQISPDELWGSLADLKPRAAKSFRSFVNELANLASDITVATADTMRNYRSESLTAQQVSSLRALLKQIVPDEIREIRGRMTLYLGDNERRLFGFRDLHSGTSYEGRVGERAIPLVEHATLGEIYDVAISAYAQLDKGAGEVKEKYVLEQLLASNDATPIPATIVTTNESSAPFI